MADIEPTPEQMQCPCALYGPPAVCTCGTCPVKCVNCEKDASRHYVMCDEDEGAWCPECFEKTACAAGVHGEGCRTDVFSDQT